MQIVTENHWGGVIVINGLSPVIPVEGSVLVSNGGNDVLTESDLSRTLSVISEMTEIKWNLVHTVEQDLFQVGVMFTGKKGPWNICGDTVITSASNTPDAALDALMVALFNAEIRIADAKVARIQTIKQQATKNLNCSW